ncbi:MAG: Fibronectin type protein [Candidatus Saccharibacteria bacterium]|nr:Fibronectin type protein [Candidatus Saccharibacteria bacterium]
MGKHKRFAIINHMANKNKRIFSLRFTFLGFLSVLSLSAGIMLMTHKLPVYAVTNPQSGSTGLNAEIPGPPPKNAAHIAFPNSGQSFDTLPVKVGGTCDGTLLIKLFKNGIFAGSTQCANGTFSISTDLFNGSNELIARVYDALDQTGPDSNTVTVNFTPTGFNNSGPRVALTSDFAKRGANPGDTLNWPIILSGGVGPYAISVDWGDGTTELISKSFTGEIDISHKYAKPGVYTVIIKVTDANGESSFLQLVAVANGALSQVDQLSKTNTPTTKNVILWWPTIAAFALVVLSFWLGSMSRLISLRKQAEKRINY